MVVMEMQAGDGTGGVVFCRTADAGCRGIELTFSDGAQLPVRVECDNEGRYSSGMKTAGYCSGWPEPDRFLQTRS